MKGKEQSGAVLWLPPRQLPTRPHHEANQLWSGLQREAVLRARVVLLARDGVERRWQRLQA